MTPLALLREIIAHGGKVAAAHYRKKPGFQTLLHHGYLLESGVLASVVCNDCDEVHTAPVVFEAGRYGYYCPAFGLVSLDHIDLKAVLPDLLRLMEKLADALDCKRRKQSPVHGQTYRIGVHRTESNEIMVYFHPKLQSEEDARELADALGREVRAQWRLTVTAVGTLPIAGMQAIQLDDLVDLDAQTGALRTLIQLDDLIGAPRKNRGGRPSRQGPALAEIISDRTNSGVALPGLNAEGRALIDEFKRRHHGKHTPSFATIKRHLKKSRGDS